MILILSAPPVVEKTVCAEEDYSKVIDSRFSRCFPHAFDDCPECNGTKGVQYDTCFDCRPTDVGERAGWRTRPR